jgi:hypothetical protein
MSWTRQYVPVLSQLQLPLPFSRASVESGWQNLNSLNTYLTLVRARLLQYDGARASFYNFQDYVWAGFWSSRVGGGWGAELQSCSSRASAAHCQRPADPPVNLFQVDPPEIGELHRRLITGLVRRSLGGRLDLVNLLKTLLLRFAATTYRFHNKISLQRRFYLTHGAHPVEDLIRREGRLGPRTGGGAVAFQQ